jgi:adenylosuccinate lyase
MDTVPNILADRYASAEMRALWSPRGRVILEREFWIAVLKAQRDLGIAVPDGVIEAYERVRDQVDLEDIRRREEVTRHDVKARIDAFCALAGHEHIHKGLTSRDLTESVEQLQLHRSLHLLRTKAVAAAAALARRASEERDTLLAARTHNVAAQPTTVGRRWAMFGEECLRGVAALDQVLATFAARGLKGAVGTQIDVLTLLGGDAAKVAALEARLLAHLGIPLSLGAVGQVYPRSMDLEAVSAILVAASGPSSFARTLRLMAGHELASEGFLPGQVGSSAMPHKMNARTCERINGLHVVLRGHLAMAASLAGEQWNEGDVSCSVVRRVLLPDACLAADGLAEAFLTVLGQMEVNRGVVAREAAHYLPFLLTTTLLMEAVKAGAGREAAHEAIKEHAVAVARELRTGTLGRNDLIDRLVADDRLRLTRAAAEAVLARAPELTGSAGRQVDAFVAEVAAWSARVPEAARVRPGRIL